MDKKYLNKFCNILKSLAPLLAKYSSYIIPLLTLFFTINSCVIRIIYENKCRNFYGIVLNCFDIKTYKYRWFTIAVILSIAFSYFIFNKILSKSKDNKFYFFISSFVGSVCLFITNLLAWSPIANNPQNSKLYKFTLDYSVLIILIIAILSTLLAVLLSAVIKINYNSKSRVKITITVLTVVLMIIQIAYLGFYIFSFGNPSPENISYYTVANVSNENGTTEYIVVGEYNSDFVCMEIQTFKNSDEIDKFIVFHTESDIEFKDKNTNQIMIEKSKYKLLSSSDIESFTTINFRNIPTDQIE